MGHLPEQYPTDQKEEEKHESHLSKKKKGVLMQVIILKVKVKQSCSLILIRFPPLYGAHQNYCCYIV